MTSETQTISGQSPRTVSYDYDADGLRTNLDYPSGVAVENQWTALGQLDTVSADGPPPLASYSYDKAGRLIETEHESGVTQARQYDDASQLLNITHTHNGVIQSGHSYQYDKAGRRTSESFLVGNTPARTYSYDAASQVTAADYGAGQTDSFNYDAMGNRTSATIASQGGGTFNYGAATKANQYTSITGRSAITHDANGNQLLNGAGAAFTWDSENRLLTVTPVSPNLGDKAHVHSYDGLHRRVTRTTREWTSSGWTNLETTYFIYDGWNVIEEWTSTFSPATTATLTRRLTWGQDLAGSPSLQGAGGVGGLLMVEEITSTTNEAYHFHYDGNGNVTEITDHLGVSVATYRYDAFGNTLVATGTYAATNRYRFSTKPLDHEVTTAPLYYYGYRYLDPLTGRWPSRDPIGEAGGVNLYGFVGNDGVNGVDALGLSRHNDPRGDPDFTDPNQWDGAASAQPQDQIDDWIDAMEHWQSNHGGEVPAGPGVIEQIKNSDGMQDNREDLKQAIENQLREKKSELCSGWSGGSFDRNGGIIGVDAGNLSVGHLDLTVEPYKVYWRLNRGSSGYGFNNISYWADRSLSFRDEYTFNGNWYNPKHWFTDFIPNLIAGDGTSYFITGSFNDHVEGNIKVCCWFEF